MKNYFTIYPAVDTKETGSAYPAVSFPEDYNWNGSQSVHKLKTHSIPTFIPDLDLILKKQAKPTDLITVAGIKGSGLTVSSRFWKFLNTQNIIPYVMFHAYISSKTEFLEYYRIHFTWEDWHQCINWRQSTFKLLENGNFVPIDINSYNEYLLEKSKIQNIIIGPDKIEYIYPDFDLFMIPFQSKIIVSEILKDSIKKLGFTGIDLKPFQIEK